MPQFTVQFGDVRLTTETTPEGLMAAHRVTEGYRYYVTAYIADPQPTKESFARALVLLAQKMTGKEGLGEWFESVLDVDPKAMLTSNEGWFTFILFGGKVRVDVPRANGSRSEVQVLRMAGSGLFEPYAGIYVVKDLGRTCASASEGFVDIEAWVTQMKEATSRPALRDIVQAFRREIIQKEAK